MRHPIRAVELVDPTRVRTLPAHFAWIDHRLRERLRELSLEEIALLLFLHPAADRTGGSFWADAIIAKKLGLREGDRHPGPVPARRQRLGRLPLPALPTPAPRGSRR
jgi:hypothetical protein